MGLYRLDAIRLQNFMAFEDTGWIDLKPVTLLFGRNSSGKSAIIRAFLVLKQSLILGNESTPLIFSGTQVDLGSFSNAVHQHVTTQEMFFLFRLAINPSAIKETMDKWQKQPVDLERNSQEIHVSEDDLINSQYPWISFLGVNPNVFEIKLGFRILQNSFGFSDGFVTSLNVNGYQVSGHSELGEIFTAILKDKELRRWEWMSGILQSFSEEERKAAFDESLGELVVNTSTREYEPFEHEIWGGSTLVCRNGFIPKLEFTGFAGGKDIPKDWNALQAILSLFQEVIYLDLAGLTHVPPLRESSKRYYSSDSSMLRGFWEARHQETLEYANQWIESVAPGCELIVEPLKPEEGLLSMYIREKTLNVEESLKINIRDVGSGFAQALPIIAALVSGSPQSTLLVEQPELHLHPVAQAQLMDLIIRMSRHGQKILLETHSDAMLLRARLRLAESNQSKDPTDSALLAKENLSILFVERKGTASTVLNMQIDRVGRFINPPASFASFFANDIDDLMRLSDIQFDQTEAQNAE